MNNFSDIQKKLDNLINNKSVALVGLGNPDRADDGFGIELTGRLKENFPDWVYSESERSVEAIVYDLLETGTFDIIIFTDAVHFKGTAGELRIFDINDIDTFASPISTHKVPMSLLMGLIQEQKKSSLLIGVQPVSLDFMGDMTSEVMLSLDSMETCFKKIFQGQV
ncbi:MAG: hydrogenase maturation protease [bacterium]